MQREILEYFLVYFSMLGYVKNNNIYIVIETIFPFFVDEVCVKMDFFLEYVLNFQLYDCFKLESYFTLINNTIWKTIVNATKTFYVKFWKLFYEKT